MTNRERLEAANILPKKMKLKPDEIEVLEKLTEQQLQRLIEMRKQVKDVSGLDMMIAPPTHHF